uniref:Putative lipocalin n=1 Tax=Rhipicephalus microplus TaxID=6941 RepID=A0A6G5A2G4_RHIMP
MVLHSLFCAVLFGVLVATRSNLHEEESNGDVDIVRFWNTSEVIWTTHTTARARQVCKVDIEEYISQTNITFTRSYLVKPTGLQHDMMDFYNHTRYNKSQEPFDAVDIKARKDRMQPQKSCTTKVPTINVLFFSTVFPWTYVVSIIRHSNKGLIYQNSFCN